MNPEPTLADCTVAVFGARIILRTPRRPEWFRRVTKIALALFLAGYFASATAGKQPDTRNATVRGTVFVHDSGGTQSLVAGARVQLKGTATLEAETDERGEYVIRAVPYGTYAVEATTTGFKAARTLRVASEEVELALELKPEAVTTSVVVTADPAETRRPAPSETISDKTLREAPNVNERFESALPLVPGVVRGPDGHVNLKGTRNTQSSALVNSANVTDPVTGSPAINLPVDVVASVQVISNPYDPEYGRFTGAVSTVATKTSDYEKFHFSFQNFIPRLRDEGDSIRGIAAATPRMTFTGPLLKDKIAITQSLEYRFVETPVNSLPAFHRDTKLESFDSYTQLDFAISSKQTANVSVAVYPQKLDYLGLNTFNTQESTPDFHQRGYQINVQDSYAIGPGGLLSSQFSYKRFDADITAQSNDPYRVLLETTEGGFFNRQRRQTSRVGWQETYHFAPWKFAGSHQFTVGLSYEHSHYDGRQTFLPVENLIVSPISQGTTGILELSNKGSDSYREFQVAARFKLRQSLLNVSYVRSRAFGDLNDLNQFFGNLAQPVIQPDERGRLPFDAPNRFLFWGSIAAPWKLTVVPVFDLHTGFPYSIEDQYRAFVGPRNVDRFPRFSSFDLQITRRVWLPLHGRRIPARVGGGVFNLFNHFDPRDVQNNLASARFGEFFNTSWREYRGKFVLEF